ncbi:MAG: right-handed parallel beta-helix repeat-containing protein, partial [Candidatus Heimdallarchaeota archaeon]|nr:right-handed parallel beta-helix repeat-containing protein [Candidatus Heimdallarchaeota archaeon]
DPYVIEDLVIDGGGSGSCIYIENSDVYFKIENCTVYNSYTGIRLSIVYNSLIIMNNCSSNSNGILLLGCKNNTISGNNATNNSYGIRLSYSDYNDVSENSANNNGYGIRLSWSDYNNVSGNIANRNIFHGIYLNWCYSTIISDNNASYNNGDGILLAGGRAGGRSAILSDNNARYNNAYGIYLMSSDGNTLSNNNASYNKLSGIFLESSDFNFLLGNTIKSNSLNGVYLRQCGNNIVEGNFIINNDVGIYMEYTLYYFNNFQSADNEISNNTFIGNNQDIRVITHVFRHPFEAEISLMFILLSIATGVVAITSLTVELITKLKYRREDEKYHPPIYGISALVVESLGALLFILVAIFLIPIDYILRWLFILIPFAIAGIIISRKGLRNDARKGLARLGLGFGIPLLILGHLLILIVLAI